jgi:hypothetical protein
VARSPDGLHVVDLKAHVLDAASAPRWAGYYRPQLDAYALALARTTREPIAGRHLLLRASGMLVTLPGLFDADAAAREALALATRLASGARGPGPGNDCARCAWRSLCQVEARSGGD